MLAEILRLIVWSLKYDRVVFVFVVCLSNKGPDVDLPSLWDVVQIYRRFGELNE